MKLGDICDIGTGSSNGNEAVENGRYPFFIRSQTVKRKDSFEFDEKAVIVPGEGGIGEIFHYIDGKYALHQRVYRIHPMVNTVNAKFVYYYMNAMFGNFIARRAVNATVTSIRKPMLEEFQIPLPPIEVQQYIVSILDRFEQFCGNLTGALPREIEAAQKRYEHYRDRLLNFGK